MVFDGNMHYDLWFIQGVSHKRKYSTVFDRISKFFIQNGIDRMDGNFPYTGEAYTTATCLSNELFCH